MPATVKGVKLNVLLPADYRASSRRYPVLYLYAGATQNQDSWLNYGDIVPFTAKFTGSRGVIVVLPASDSSTFGFGLDWRNKKHLFETHFVRYLVPYIDSHFRTRAGRRYRAIAGLSAGGFNSAHYAARHPDLFAAVGSFSGWVNFPSYHEEEGETVIFPLERALNTCAGGAPDDEGVFGDPVRDSIWWHNANPSDLAPNFGSLNPYFAVGDGTPCDAEDAQSLKSPLNFLEPIVHDQALTFEAKLTEAGVRHTPDFYGCGIHGRRYYIRDLHLFWPKMMRAFGTKAPRAFDFRRADSQFSVWGWSFHADSRRAAEFLDIRGASRTGITLTGSGEERVTTGRLFKPGEVVQVSGASLAIATAIVDSRGRISFGVDLGAPHRAQQYTAQQRVMDGPGYFRRRTVKFRVLSHRRGDGGHRRPRRRRSTCSGHGGRPGSQGGRGGGGGSCPTS